MTEERVEKAIAELDAAMAEYCAEKGVPNVFSPMLSQVRSMLALAEGAKMTVAEPAPELE